MSLTAIVTSHNYAQYLSECLSSCQRYCDDVLVYDDASDDESVEIIRAYGIEPTVNGTPSGGPIWGSNLGIKDTRTTHLIFVDADNFLLSKPPELYFDYVFGDIALANHGGHITGHWVYDNRPQDWYEALRFWQRDPRQIPVPWGGVWRTEFVQSNGLSWTDWDTENFAPDMRTCIDWLQHEPTIARRGCFMAFRQHEGQMTASDRRTLVEEESCRLAHSIGEIRPSHG